jgi:NAD(P)-dependent dehydrogenase (short-subunit alcohol dehydrogenase family)
MSTALQTARGLTRTDRLGRRVAIVIGGGAPENTVGVGQAAALAYAAAGARIAIIDANIGNARRTARLLDDAIAIEADITDEAAIAAAITAIVERYDRIDILHNNVGLPRAGAFDQFTGADWMHGMAVNCIGAAIAIRHSLPHLVATRGAIVNVSSIASIRYTGMNYAIYNVSKAALDQLTVAVALEYADRGVRANAILPGLLDTDMGRSLADPDDLAARDRRCPTGQQGDVWDVAHAAVFLASDDARYINGHLLVVDGGLSRRC